MRATSCISGKTQSLECDSKDRSRYARRPPPESARTCPHVDPTCDCVGWCVRNGIPSYSMKNAKRPELATPVVFAPSDKALQDLRSRDRESVDFFMEQVGSNCLRHLLRTRLAQTYATRCSFLGCGLGNRSSGPNGCFSYINADLGASLSRPIYESGLIRANIPCEPEIAGVADRSYLCRSHDPCESNGTVGQRRACEPQGSIDIDRNKQPMAFSITNARPFCWLAWIARQPVSLFRIRNNRCRARPYSRTDRSVESPIKLLHGAPKRNEPGQGSMRLATRVTGAKPLIRVGKSNHAAAIKCIPQRETDRTA